MSGSGTIPIEAALIATNTAPGLLRLRPACSRWSDEDAFTWMQLTEEANAAKLPKAPKPIMANDWHGGAMRLAQRAAKAAGVEASITFSQSDVLNYSPQSHPEIVVTNPPWDRRLCGAEESWRGLSSFLRRECRGSTAWILSGNKALTKHLRMRASRRLKLENAGDSLALITYEVLPAKDDVARTGPTVRASSPTTVAAHTMNGEHDAPKGVHGTIHDESGHVNSRLDVLPPPTAPGQVELANKVIKPVDSVAVGASSEVAVADASGTSTTELCTLLADLYGDFDSDTDS